MKNISSLFRFDDALIPNLLAWSYVLFSYVLGFAAIMTETVWMNVAGVILLAHSMVIAAYFIHECAHDSLFKKSSHNHIFGEILLWITGASYSDYEAIRHKHVRHHMDRADIVSFDFRERLLKYPKTLKTIQVFEYFYLGFTIDSFQSPGQIDGADLFEALLNGMIVELHNGMPQFGA